ncbi:MAG: 50S ribosomal protein L30 [Bacillota bacterium]
MSELRITLIKSIIGSNKRQRATVAALGFRRVNQTVVKEDSPVARGMLAKVRHLVRVEQA